MYKAIRKDANEYTTDWGDKIEKCFCNGSFTVYTTEDWVADKIFTVKGEYLA